MFFFPFKTVNLETIRNLDGLYLVTHIPIKCRVLSRKQTTYDPSILGKRHKPPLHGHECFVHVFAIRPTIPISSLTAKVLRP